MGSTPTRSVVRLVVAATAIVILAAACTTSGGGTSSGPSTGASAVPAAASPSTSSGGGRYGSEDEYGSQPSSAPAASEDSGGVHLVGLGNGPDGAYLTGTDGRTLYVFGNDSANTSTCEGGCATTWPPFTIAKGDEIKADAGVKGKLTTFARSDGSMQVAYDRSPLYYYVDDKAAGETNGQGVGDVWFIAKP